MENWELHCYQCFTTLKSDNIVIFAVKNGLFVNTVYTPCKHSVNTKSVNRVFGVNTKMKNVPAVAAGLPHHI